MVQMPLMVTEKEATRPAPRAMSLRDPNCKTPLATLPADARIERALLLLAYFIELDGDVHAPMYERFEAELLRIRSLKETRKRARQRLLDYSGFGGRNTICSKKFEYNS